MKKIFVLIFVLIMLCFCSINNNYAEELFCQSQTAKVCFYCDECNEFENATTIVNGQSYIVETSAGYANEVYKNLDSCVGFSIVFNKNEIDIETLLQGVRVVKEETAGENFTIYGITNGLAFSTFIDNKKVNIQITQNNDFIIVGSPIILGSY